jgi:hypothetical protein
LGHARFLFFLIKGLEWLAIFSDWVPFWALSKLVSPWILHEFDLDFIWGFLSGSG